MPTTLNAPGKTLAAAAPEWSKWAAGWHVHPLGFVRAPTREKDRGAAPVNRIRKLIDWLPYAQELEPNVLQLVPVFGSASHDYDTEDYYRVDLRLDIEEDVKVVIETTRERGAKVLFDGVFNYIGSETPALKTVKENPDSEEAQLLAFTHSADSTVAPVLEDYESLIGFDHTNDATTDFVVSVVNYWLARGIDGWRLDAACAVDPQFQHRALPRVRAEHPHAFIYDKVIHGDCTGIVSVFGVNSVIECELWEAAWPALKEENFFELDQTLKHHNIFVESPVPMTFVGNHDVSHIATQVGAGKVVLAVIALFTAAGVLLVYYGNGQDYTGPKEKHIGGDDQIRPVFPDRPGELSMLGADLYRTYQQLIAVRHRFPWLHPARVETDESCDGFLHYRVTATDAVLVGDTAGTPGEVGASGEMPPLVVKLDLENDATNAVICDGDHVELELSQALITALDYPGKPKPPGHHVRAVILSCPIGEWA